MLADEKHSRTEPRYHALGKTDEDRLLIPGECFNRTIVRYLQFARDFNTRFPGFETDIHGLVDDPDAAGAVHYYVDCATQ